MIDDCWVLTAAHCLYTYDTFPTTGNVFVVLGDTNRFEKEFTENIYEVELLFVHPGYDGGTHDNDIALLKLKCKVKYKSQVRKICLPRSVDEQYYTSGTLCIVAGWGHTQISKISQLNVPLSTVLRHVALPVQDTGHCRSSTSYLVTDNMFCAGSGNHGYSESACHGDDGGPFFCRRRGQGTPKYVMTGIVSWGEGCGTKGQYGYYTHVMRMMNWIDAKMNEYVGCSHTFQTCPSPKVQFV